MGETGGRSLLVPVHADLAIDAPRQDSSSVGDYTGLMVTLPHAKEWRPAPKFVTLAEIC
jgi:hypothetical protein